VSRQYNSNYPGAGLWNQYDKYSSMVLLSKPGMTEILPEYITVYPSISTVQVKEKGQPFCKIK
jgi:hypothetical protein